MTNQNQNQNHTEYIQLPNENAAGGSPLDALAVPTPAESDAEKTGTLDETMIRIAESTQDQVDKSIARVLGRIEPALVVVLSLLVGGVLMSVMFPLLGILSGM